MDGFLDFVTHKFANGPQQMFLIFNVNGLRPDYCRNNSRNQRR